MILICICHLFYYKFVKLLVFTKNLIFKKLIFIIFFLIFIKLLFSSSNGVFPVPLYITFLESSDGNAHVCHRKDYLEFMELANFDTEIDSGLISNYEHCDYLIKHDDYETWEYVDKKLNRKTLDSY